MATRATIKRKARRLRAMGHPREAERLWEQWQAPEQSQEPYERRVAQSVVCRMSIDDLRRVWVPLGVVFDAINEIR